jgi:hypothetical protein
MDGPISADLRPYLPSNYVDTQGNLTVSDTQATQVAQEVKAHVKDLPPAEQQLYLALLSSPDFAPGANISMGDLDADLGKLDKAEKAITQAMTDAAASNFLGLAEDVNALAKILVIQASQARQTAHEQQKSELQKAKSDLEAQASAQSKAADDLSAAAVKSLVMACVGAAISIGAASAQVVGGAKAIKNMNKVNSGFKGLDAEAKANFNSQKSVMKELGIGESKSKGGSTSEKSTSGAQQESGENTVEPVSEPSQSQKTQEETVQNSQNKKLENQQETEKTDAKNDKDIKDEKVQNEAANEKAGKRKELEDLKHQGEVLSELNKIRDREIGELNKFEKVLGPVVQSANAAGNFLTAGANSVSQLGQADSQRKQAEGSLDAAAAQDEQAKADMEKEIEGHLDDLIKTMIAAAKEIQDSKAQAMESMTRV